MDFATGIIGLGTVILLCFFIYWCLDKITGEKLVNIDTRFSNIDTQLTNVATKVELLQIRKDFTTALEEAVVNVTNEIKRVDAHCTGTVNDNAKNICTIVKNSIEEYFENKK